MTAEAFEIAVADDVLDDVQERLALARLPSGFDDDGWTYGMDMAYLRELVDYWRDSYDWRAHEAAMNRFDHFRATIDDVPIHFVHARGKGPRPIPLLLSHGWPWTFWDYKDVIGPLADPSAHGGDPDDAFDVVVPSLPGFGFSTPLPRPGVDWQDTADLFATLMVDVLGYERFGASGGDWGRAITLLLGHRFAERMIGVHVLGSRPLGAFNGERPWAIFSRLPPDLPEERRRAMLDLERRYASHFAVHMLDPLTLAAGLHDSPVGLCSWLLERRRSWSDCDGDVESRFSKDSLLTATMIYWVTESFASSARFYAYAAGRPWIPDHDGALVVEAPTGLSVFRRDEPFARGDDEIRREWNLQFRRDHERGGHYPPAEEPQAVVADLRDFFRPLRRAG